MILMNKEKFEKFVEEGINALPEKFLQKLSNVDIVIEDTPSKNQLKKLKIGRESLLLGLYEGVPQTKRWGYGYGGPLPDKITIFQRPIEQSVRSDQQIREIVKNTIWHEIAHHFGMDEREIRLAEHRTRNR